jgi:hypothetical protein
MKIFTTYHYSVDRAFLHPSASLQNKLPIFCRLQPHWNSSLQLFANSKKYINQDLRKTNMMDRIFRIKT